MAGGRPKTLIDYDIVKDLAEIHCTQQEIANILHCSVKTLQRDEEFCRIYKEGIDQGKKCLRRLQWSAAKEGNTTMLVWLGKQYLSQVDKKEVSMDLTAHTTKLDNLIEQSK
jgi:hypothetical protein